MTGRSVGISGWRMGRSLRRARGARVGHGTRADRGKLAGLRRHGFGSVPRRHRHHKRNNQAPRLRGRTIPQKKKTRRTTPQLAGCTSAAYALRSDTTNRSAACDPTPPPRARDPAPPLARSPRAAAAPRGSPGAEGGRLRRPDFIELFLSDFALFSSRLQFFLDSLNLGV